MEESGIIFVYRNFESDLRCHHMSPFVGWSSFFKELMSNHQRKKIGSLQIEILELIPNWIIKKNMFFETYVQLFQSFPSNVLALITDSSPLKIGHMPQKRKEKVFQPGAYRSYSLEDFRNHRGSTTTFPTPTSQSQDTRCFGGFSGAPSFEVKVNPPTKQILWEKSFSRKDMVV